MKNLAYYKSLAKNDESVLCLMEPHISGGTISIERINQIRHHPDKKFIIISGLKQDTFEYFVNTYGNQFDAIKFLKCPLVQDFSSIEGLKNIQYIIIKWNQRVEKLWDLSKTSSLLGLSFEDFTRLHHLGDIAKSKTLQELQFGDGVWDKLILDSLSPLTQCQTLKKIKFSAKKIIDDKIEPLCGLANLEEITFPGKLFSTQQVAWLKAHLPDTIQSTILEPLRTIKSPIIYGDKKKDTFIIGKKKPFLSSQSDCKRIEKYKNDFYKMYNWYKSHLDAKPEEYSLN